MSTDAYSALFRHIIGLYLIIVVVAFITHRIVTADSIEIRVYELFT